MSPSATASNLAFLSKARIVTDYHGERRWHSSLTIKTPSARRAIAALSGQGRVRPRRCSSKSAVEKAMHAPPENFTRRDLALGFGARLPPP